MSYVESSSAGRGPKKERLRGPGLKKGLGRREKIGKPGRVQTENRGKSNSCPKPQSTGEKKKKHVIENPEELFLYPEGGTQRKE